MDRSSDKIDRRDRARTYSALTIIGLSGLVIMAILIVIAAVFTYGRSEGTKNELENITKDAERACKDSLVTEVFVVGNADGASSASFLNADRFDQLWVTTGNYTSPSEPLWVEETGEVWIVDSTSNRVFVYDSLSRKLVDDMDTANFGCVEPFSPAYSPDSGGDDIAEIWISCAGSEIFLVFAPVGRELIATPEIPDGLKPTHSPGVVAVGPDYAAAVFYPSTIAIYRKSAPATLVTQVIIPGASDLSQIWYGDHGSKSRLYIYSDTVTRLYQLQWGTWAISPDSAVIAPSVSDITTSEDEKYVYASVPTTPGTVRAISAASMLEVTGSPVTVPGATSSAVSLAADLDGDMLAVGTDSGVVFRYFLDGDTGLPVSPIPIVSAKTTPPGAFSNGKIAPARLRCPCASCSSSVKV